MEADPSPRPGASGPLVRPYLMTGGRTPARADLRLETLVRANDGVRRPPEPEQVRVLQAAREPASIVDLSVRTLLPIGVVRILVHDLEGVGSITVYGDSEDPDEDLVRRLISGVESL